MIKRYSKSSGFYVDAKSAFFDGNDGLLAKARYQNSLYCSQPDRLACKLCATALPEGEDFRSHGVGYVFCVDCGHLNGRHDDTREFVEALYIGDAGTEYARNYVDENFERRTREVYVPKVEFLLSGLAGAPVSVLDVGCGAGYFVAACALQGVTATGMDVSQALIAFGNEQLRRLGKAEAAGLTQVDESGFFEAVVATRADVVSAVGVIEHLRQPQLLFDAFHRSSARYLYYSVPMFSLSVILENVFSEVFPRQLSGGHTHLFTEASIRRMHDMAAAESIAEWRFGTDVMDLYRSLMVMLARNQGSAKLLDVFGKSFAPGIDALQSVLDESHFCSEIHCVLKKSA